MSGVFCSHLQPFNVWASGLGKYDPKEKSNKTEDHTEFLCLNNRRKTQQISNK